MVGIRFARAVLFTHGWAPAHPLPGIELVTIAPIRSGADYSAFVVRELPLHIRTSHVLVTQWDGFVIDPSAWRDEFLVHDYIGAVWPEQPRGLSVGNGGFSLRSRRLLMAGMDARIQELHPEDKVLCRTQRRWLEERHGVSFAPPELARHFAFENESPCQPTFGFHGPYNLPRVLDEATLSTWLDALPDDFFRGRDARRLARALLVARMPALARRAIDRRIGAGRSEPGTRMLGAAANAIGLLRAHVARARRI